MGELQSGVAYTIGAGGGRHNLLGRCATPDATPLAPKAGIHTNDGCDA